MIMAANTANNSHASTTSARKRTSRTRSRRAELSLEDLQEDLRAVSRDIAKLRADATEVATGGVRRGAASVLESAKNVASRSRESYDEAAEWVSEHPAVTIMLAIGVGAVAARLLTRSR
mgnify:CR=1 FL=1